MGGNHRWNRAIARMVLVCLLLSVLPPAVPRVRAAPPEPPPTPPLPTTPPTVPPRTVGDLPPATRLAHDGITLTEESATRTHVTGGTYTATVDLGHLTVRGQAAQESVRLELTAATIGTTSLVSPAARFAVRGAQPAWMRSHSAIVHEDLQALAGGMKHNLVLSEPITTAQGDLVVTYHLQTPLQAVLLSSHAGVALYRPGTRRTAAPVLAISPVIVQDAAGRTLIAPLTLQGKRLTAMIPAAVLRDAVYPLTIDPLVGDPQAVSSGTSVPQAPTVVRTGTPGHYFLIHTDTQDGRRRVEGQGWSVEGEPTGGSFYLSDGPAAHPETTFLTATNELAVVWEHLDPSGSAIGFQRRGWYTGPVSPVQYLTPMTGTIALPQIEAHPLQGQYLVLWHDVLASSLRRQWVSGTGEIVGTASTVLTGVTTLDALTLTYLPATASSLVTMRTSATIQVLPLDANGDPLGTPTVVTSGLSSGTRIEATALATGTMTLAWDTMTTIETMRIDASGTLLEAPQTIVSGTTPLELGDLVYSPTPNHMTLAWTEPWQGRVMLRHLTAQNMLSGTPWSLVDDPQAEVQHVQMAEDPPWQTLGVAWSVTTPTAYQIDAAVLYSATGGVRAGPFTLIQPRSLADNQSLTYQPTTDTYLLAWRDRNAGTTAYTTPTLYLRVLDHQGTPLTDPVSVTSPLGTIPDAPVSVARTLTETWFLAWDATLPDGRHQIEMIEVSKLGQPVAASHQVLTDSTRDARMPLLVANPDDATYLLAWNQVGWGTTGYATVFQRLDSTGTPFGTATAMPQGAGKPMGVYHPGRQEYFLVWDNPIRGQRIAPDGSFIGSPVTITSVDARPCCWMLDMAVLPDADQYGIVWLDINRYGTQPHTTYLQRVAGDGTLVGGEITVAPPQTGHFQAHQRVIASPSTNTYHVLWTDNYQVYGRHVGTDGAFHGDIESYLPAMLGSEYMAVGAQRGELPESLVTLLKSDAYGYRGTTIYAQWYQSLLRPTELARPDDPTVDDIDIPSRYLPDEVADDISEDLEQYHTVTSVFDGSFDGQERQVVRIGGTHTVYENTVVTLDVPPGLYTGIQVDLVLEHNARAVTALYDPLNPNGFDAWAAFFPAQYLNDSFQDIAASLYLHNPDPLIHSQTRPTTVPLKLKFGCEGLSRDGVTATCIVSNIRVYNATPGWYADHPNWSGGTKKVVHTTAASAITSSCDLGILNGLNGSYTSEGVTTPAVIVESAVDSPPFQAPDESPFLCYHQVENTFNSVNLYSAPLLLPEFQIGDVLTVDYDLTYDGIQEPNKTYDHEFALRSATTNTNHRFVNLPYPAGQAPAYTVAQSWTSVRNLAYVKPLTMTTTTLASYAHQWFKIEIKGSVPGSFTGSSSHLRVGVDNIQFYLNGEPLTLGMDARGWCICDTSGNPQPPVGDPVNSFDRGYYLQAADLMVPTAAQPLLVDRTYFSSITDTTRIPPTPFGPGWRSTSFESLTLPDDPTYGVSYTITYEAASGDRFDFYTEFPDTGPFRPEPGLNATLERTATGYVIVTTTGRKLFFDLDGRLAVTQTPLGYETTYSYDPTSELLTTVEDTITDRTLTLGYTPYTVPYTTVQQPRLTSVTDSLGRSTTYTYDGNGMLNGVTDMFGRRTAYAYADLTDPTLLTQVVPPSNTTLGATRSTPMVTNTYQNGRISHQQEGSGLETTWSTGTSATGLTETTRLMTGAAGTVDSQTLTYRQDRSIRSTARNGIFESYTTFDRTLKPTELVQGNGTIMTARYNGDGHATMMGATKAVEPISGGSGSYGVAMLPTPLTQTLSYDTQNRPLLISGMTGATQVMSYTARGALGSQGVKLSANGPTTQETTYTFTGDTTAGSTDLVVPATATTPRGQTVELSYGNPSTPWLVTQSVIEAGTSSALTTTYLYDTFDRATHVTQGVDTPEETTTFYVYRTDGQLATMIEGWTPTVTTTDPGYQVHRRTDYGYDAAGRQIWVKQNGSRYLAYTKYDELGRVMWTLQNPIDPTTPLANTPQLPALSATTPPAFDPLRPDGNIATLYGYDDLGRVTQITQTGILTGDLVLRTEYANPKLFFTQATERVTHIGYDDLHRPVTRTLNYRPEINGGSFDPQYSDVNVQTLTRYDGSGNIIASRDVLGRWSTTDYDAYGRPVTVTLNYENGDPLTIRSNGQTVPLPSTRPITTELTDIVSVTRYDAAGRVVETINNYIDGIHDPAFPLEDRITVMEHDVLGRTTAVTTNVGLQGWGHAYNRTSETVFDPQTGQLLGTQDVKGQWSVPQRDEFARTTHTIQNCRDAQGNPAWTDCVTPTTRTDQSVLSSRTTAYDGLGRGVETTARDGTVTRQTFDGLGRAVSTTRNRVAGAPADAETNVTTTSSYASTHTMSTWSRQTDATGVSSRTDVDSVGRMVTRYDAGNRATWTWSDTTGQQRWQLDPAGNISMTHVDGLGRVIKTVTNYVDGVPGNGEQTDQDLVSTTTYDAAGRVLATQAAVPAGPVTTMAYNARDQLVAITENTIDPSVCAIPHPSTGDARTDCNVTTVYQYDRQGNLIRMTDAGHYERIWDYSVADERIRETHGPLSRDWMYTHAGEVYAESPRKDNGASTMGMVATSRDELGRVVITHDGMIGSGVSGNNDGRSPMITTSYDTAGRRQSVSEETFVGVSATTVTYLYDDLGRLTRSSDPTGIVDYAYDAAGRRTQVTAGGTTTTTAYDAEGRPSQVWQGASGTGSLLATYSYSTTTGLLETVTRPGNVVTSYTYDRLGRMVRKTTVDSTQTVIHDWDGKYDRQGRITLVSQLDPTLVPGNYGQYHYEWYEYDGGGRLVYVGEPTGATTTMLVRYDVRGNRLMQEGTAVPTQSWGYTVGSQVVGWSYDAAGNLVDDGEHSYTFDLYNRLQKVDTAGTATYYRYLDGVLTGEAPTVDGAVTTSYTQDRQSVLSRILQMQTSSTVTGLHYGGMGEHLLTSRPSGDQYTLTNHQGTPQVTMSASGSVVDSDRYTPWGEALGTTTPDPLGFTGELQNAATGLVYLRARWYNPEMGIFLGRDPFDGRYTQPASMHAYQYAWNTPVMHTDPSGRDPWWLDPGDSSYNPECVNAYLSPAVYQQLACDDLDTRYQQWLNMQQPYRGECIFDVPYLFKLLLTPFTRAWDILKNTPERWRRTWDVLTYPNRYILRKMWEGADRVGRAAIKANDYVMRELEQGIRTTRNEALERVVPYVSRFAPPLGPPPGAGGNSGSAGVGSGVFPVSALPPQKECNPAAALAYKNRIRRTANVTQKQDWREYQARVTGEAVGTDFHSVFNGGQIDADGINEEICAYQEAKYVGNLKSSPHVGNAQLPAIQAGADAKFIDEMERYRMGIEDPLIPLTKIQVITNYEESATHLSELVKTWEDTIFTIEP